MLLCHFLLFHCYFNGTILHSDCDSLGHYICQVIDHNHSIFIKIYGYNSKPENDKLIDSIDARLTFWLSKYPSSFILIVGDFNITLNNSIDRWPHVSNSRDNLKMKTFMEKLNVVDIWRENFLNNISYTWSNSSGSRKSRIDFYLISNNITKDKCNS